jgi:hypothetical protein
VGGVYFAGTGLNLSGGNTFNISNTTVSAGSYGSGSAVGTFTVNAQGQLTAAADTNIAIAATQITSGTIDSARLSGTYSGITGVGTLTNLTVSNPITGSITGNAGTATTATTATSATTATNIAGGAAASIPVQTGAGVTSFLPIGTNGQVLTIAGGVPSYATPTTGTVTSVSGTGTVSGISLSGTVTSSGNLTLGGTLDLSAPPTIGNTTPNTGRFTTLTVDDNTTLGSSNADTVDFVARVSSEFSPATDNTFDLGRTGHEWRDLFIDGTANIDSLVADTADINAGTIDNTTIGTTTAAAAKVTTLDVTSTLALNGDTGVSGYVITSNGASAPTWQANANGLAIADDTTTNSSFYLTFTSASTGNITTANVSSTKLQFNPSTGALSSTLVGIDSDGTASVPSIFRTSDTNTGIFFPAADTIGLATGGVEAARLVSGLLSVPANSTAASAVRLFEDTDNGTNYVDIIAPASIASDSTLTLPSITGTLALNTMTTQVFLASGTYTRPTGLAYALVYVKGGGASGASSTSAGFGASGGEGEEAWGLFTAATIGATQTVTIGAGGAAVTANTSANGNAGGTTSFGALVTAAGAAGGTRGNFGGAPSAGGSGGTGGFYRMRGAAGVTGADTGGTGPQYNPGGGKGGGIFATAAGANSGGGGGGGSTGNNSGAGGSGICVVYEYY